MKRLTRKQETEKQILLGKMTEQKDALEVEIAQYNETMAEAWARVVEVHANLGAAVSDAEVFRQEINDAQEEYFDERSDTWQEGDAGSNYSCWKDDWGQELVIDELDSPDEVEMPDIEVIEQFELLTEGPG